MPAASCSPPVNTELRAELQVLLSNSQVFKTKEMNETLAEESAEQNLKWSHFNDSKLSEIHRKKELWISKKFGRAHLANFNLSS